MGIMCTASTYPYMLYTPFTCYRIKDLDERSIFKADSRSINYAGNRQDLLLGTMLLSLQEKMAFFIFLAASKPARLIMTQFFGSFDRLISAWQSGLQGFTWRGGCKRFVRRK